MFPNPLIEKLNMKAHLLSKLGPTSLMPSNRQNNKITKWKI